MLTAHAAGRDLKRAEALGKRGGHRGRPAHVDPHVRSTGPAPHGRLCGQEPVVLGVDDSRPQRGVLRRGSLDLVEIQGSGLVRDRVEEVDGAVEGTT